MTEKKNTEIKKPPEIMMRQSWDSRLAQWLGVVGSLAVFIIMYFQLSAIRNEQNISLRPYINVLEQTVIKEQYVGKENEIWDLYYLLQNTGQYPAVQVHYKIEYSTQNCPVKIC